jgi:hypothetical protein
MTNKTQSNIEQVVMARVGRIYILRFIFNGFVGSALLLLAALYAIGREVWVARVFENAPGDLFASAQFFLSAFSHTQFVVQLLTLVAAVSLIYLARATARLVTGALVPQSV